MLTREQKEIRRNGIGGSDCAAIAGLSRYKSNVDVYLEKLGFKESDSGNEASYWGSALENILLNEYRIRNKELKISKPEKLITCKKYPWMFANIDGWIDSQDAVLECKTASIYKSSEWGEQETDEIPDEYLMQCAHYRIVTDCNFVAIAVLIGGQEYRQYKYEKNLELENQVINIEHDFWHKHVLLQEPPEIKTYEDALKLFNNAQLSSKTADEKIISYLQGYLYAKDKIKEFTEQADSLKAKVAGYLGEDSVLINEIGQELATWKVKKANRLDIDGLKKSHPDIYQQFIKTSQTREFRLKEIK